MVSCKKFNEKALKLKFIHSLDRTRKTCSHCSSFRSYPFDLPWTLTTSSLGTHEQVKVGGILHNKTEYFRYFDSHTWNENTVPIQLLSLQHLINIVPSYCTPLNLALAIATPGKNLSFKTQFRSESLGQIVYYFYIQIQGGNQQAT